jgi:hypothetical protein
MNTTALRLSGLALMAGALVTAGAIALLAAGGRGLANRPVDTMLLVGAILLGLGWQGMYARQADAAGWTGLLGHILLQVGTVLLILAGAKPLFNPTITDLDFVTTFFSLGVALFLGFVLTTIATLRARVYPRWAGMLLVLASLAFGYMFFLDHFFPAWVLAGGGALFGVAMVGAFVGIGGSLVGSAQESRAVSAPVVG